TKFDAQIEAEAQIDPVDKQSLEEVKIAEAVQEDQKELEAAEKLQEDLNSGTESTEESAKTKKEEKTSQTPEYKDAVERVKKLQEQFAALPIDENADALLFELREARQALQKIAGTPKSTGKKTETQKQIEDATGVTKPEKSIQLTPQQALAAQIRIQDRGIKI